MSNKKPGLSLVLIVMFAAQSAFALPLATQIEEKLLSEVVDQYFAAFGRKQTDEMMRFWDTDSSFLSARRSEIEKMLTEMNSIEIKSTRVCRIEIAGERARLRACVEMNAIEAKTGKMVASKIIRSLYLVKIESRWKICRDESTDEDIAAALASAKADERESLIAAEKEFLTEGLTRLLYRQGTQLRGQGRAEEAIARYRLSQTVSEYIDYKAGVAIALTGIGNVYTLRIDNARALEFFLEALRICEKLDDKNLHASILNNVGGAYKDLGEMALAEQHLRKGLELSGASKNDRLRAHILLVLADVLMAQCNYTEAMTTLQQCLALAEAVRYEYAITASQANMGIIHLAQGNYEQALNLYDKAFKMSELSGQKSGMAAALAELSRVHALSGDYQKALDYSQKSLTMAEETKSRALIWIALRANGRAHHLTGNYEQAIEKLQSALTISEESRNRMEIVDGLIQLGSIHYAKGDNEKSLELAERAASMAASIGAIQNHATARAIMGRSLRAMNQPDKAALALAEAIELIESLRFKVAGGDEDRQRFFENRVSPYHEMVGLMASQNRVALALDYAERAKARVLLDVLQSGRVDISKAMTRDERERERGLRMEQASLNNQLRHQRGSASSDSSRITELETRLHKARLDYDEFQSRLYTAHPELRARRGETRPLKLEEASALIPGSTGALLEYAVTDEGTFLFIIERTGGGVDLKVHSIPVSRKEVASLVESFRHKLATRDPGFRRQAKRLYDIFVKPAREMLQGKTALIIVPDDALWELPFQSLMTDSNRYLIEESAISYAPSLSVLREMTRQRKRRGGTVSLLAMGNPLLDQKTSHRTGASKRSNALAPLPGTEAEVKALAELYGAAQSRIYTGADAREDRVKAEAGKFTILHFAMHGILEDSSPMHSCLVLSQGEADEDGLLEARELMEMDLQADLVVLSACETARGRFGRGEGMIGLSWALFVAGTPTAVLSQWKVDQASTSQLMVDFHRNLKSRQTKAESIRAASLKLMRSREYRHPFYWAGFVVIGDGF